jgi:hypothetical protein
MHLNSATLLRAATIGIGATLVMDLWNVLLKRAFNIPSLNYCLLGRWVLHMAAGRFRHASIAAAPPKSHECPMGWVAHYTIGAALAVGFVYFVVPHAWIASPTVLPALLFGTVTVVFPLFVMQPALGLGVASSRVPRPAQARLKSLGTHTIFGLGLYSCAWALNHFLGSG